VGNSPRYALNMRLGGPYTLSGSIQIDTEFLLFIIFIQQTHIDIKILNYINYLFLLIYINYIFLLILLIILIDT